MWWDAVRVPQSAARGVLEFLGDASGAVIEDPYGRVCYWLIRRCSAARWDTASLPLVEVLQNAEMELSYLAVPPAARVKGPGPYWRVPIAPSRYLTAAPALLNALRTVLHDGAGPLRSGLR